jgi:transposase
LAPREGENKALLGKHSAKIQSDDTARLQPLAIQKADPLIERFLSKLKCYRRIATRYDKLGMNFLAMTKLACVRLTLRHNETVA